MISRMARGLTLCCGMAAALVANPSESHALCGLFDCLFGGCRTTYYGGSSCGYSPCATTACSPCATTACSPCGSSCSPCNTTVCNYMPQTCYRAECVNVPVTTYRCVSSCDPCTGCPTTAMVPTTSFVRQVRYAPYTTYRPVCSTVAAPVLAAPAVAPAASLYPAHAAPAGGCCTPASATLSAPTYAAPTTTYAVPGTPGTVIQSGPATIPATPMPSLNNNPTITPLPRPIPDAQINGSNGQSSGTWTYDPDSRTTRRDVPRPRDEEQSGLVVPAVYSAPAVKSLDDSGWRAARR